MYHFGQRSLLMGRAQMGEVLIEVGGVMLSQAATAQVDASGEA